MNDPKTMLVTYLGRERAAVLWKLEGISERKARTPMTPTGSTLLGIVKHLGSVEYGYFGATFGRPPAEEMPWAADADRWNENDDMWATAEQTPEWIAAFYRRAIDHANQTIQTLDLDAPGLVPWWPPESRQTTLRRVLLHMTAETARHAGQMDIMREMLDGQVGCRPDNPNMPEHDAAWWQIYNARLQALAEAAPE